MNLHRLLAMARKESIQIRRDTRSLIMAFVLPLALIVFFGYAISFDVKNIEMGVLDRDRTQESRLLAQAFARSGYFDIVYQLETDGEVEALMARGVTRLVLVIPPGFAKDLGANGTPARLQLVLDGSDANTATIAQGYADAIVGRFARNVVLDGTRLDLPVEAESRIWFNESLESVNMIVPGLVAVITSIIAALLTALTIAREWERGTMEQLAATPVGRLEVVLGKLLPYVAIGVVDVILAVLAGVVIFEVPLRGSILLLGVLTLFFIVGALAFGMFISAALKTQVLATQVAMVATYLPALLLSGFLFSIANMPAPLRLFTYLVPARYYIAVTRGIFLKGVGIDVMWVQGIAMVLFATAGLGLALRAFRKEIA